MIAGAADSHKLLSHFADKCVVAGGYGAVSWDCDSDVLSMHWSVCSFVPNNGIAGGHRCRAPCLSGFLVDFRKTRRLPGRNSCTGLLKRLKTAALYRCREILLTFVFSSMDRLQRHSQTFSCLNLLKYKGVGAKRLNDRAFEVKAVKRFAVFGLDVPLGSP